MLKVGDYGAEHAKGPDLSVVERKGVADLFNSYTSGYDQERNKILKAKELGLTFILAIEASASEILKGHSYWDGERRREHPKTGLAMIRQLCTLNRKYGVQVWFCTSRLEMSWRISSRWLRSPSGSVTGAMRTLSVTCTPSGRRLCTTPCQT